MGTHAVVLQPEWDNLDYAKFRAKDPRWTTMWVLVLVGLPGKAVKILVGVWLMFVWNAITTPFVELTIIAVHRHN